MKSLKRDILAAIAATVIASAPAAAQRPALRSFVFKTDMTRVGHYSGNVAVETDLGDWFSLAVPFYWSLVMKNEQGGWKAGRLELVPEFRYWFKGLYNGFYAGIHAPLQINNAYFGYRPGKDEVGTSIGPFGAGIGAGFRFNLPKNMSWLGIEAGVGAGYYGKDYRGGYTHFIPDYRLISLRATTASGASVGLDQAYISLIISLGKRPDQNYLLHWYW